MTLLGTSASAEDLVIYPDLNNVRNTNFILFRSLIQSVLVPRAAIQSMPMKSGMGTLYSVLFYNVFLCFTACAAGGGASQSDINATLDLTRVKAGEQYITFRPVQCQGNFRYLLHQLDLSSPTQQHMVQAINVVSSTQYEGVCHSLMFLAMSISFSLSLYFNLWHRHYSLSVTAWKHFVSVSILGGPILVLAKSGVLATRPFQGCGEVCPTIPSPLLSSWLLSFLVCFLALAHLGICIDLRLDSFRSFLLTCPHSCSIALQRDIATKVGSTGRSGFRYNPDLYHGTVYQVVAVNEDTGEKSYYTPIALYSCKLDSTALSNDRCRCHLYYLSPHILVLSFFTSVRVILSFIPAACQGCALTSRQMLQRTSILLLASAWLMYWSNCIVGVFFCISPVSWRYWGAAIKHGVR